MNTENKVIVKNNPFTMEDFDSVEQWLNDLAAQGLRLKKLGYLTAKFEKTDSNDAEANGKPLRYCVLPTRYSSMNVEEREIYSSSGWEYVPSGGVSVFCTEDENAPEIFTDDATFRRYCRRIIRWEIAATAIWLFLLYQSLKDLPIIPDGPGGSYFSKNSWSPAVYVLLTALGVLTIALIALLIIRRVRMMKRVRDGRTAQKGRSTEAGVYEAADQNDDAGGADASGNAKATAAREPSWKRAYRRGVLCEILCVLILAGCAGIMIDLHAGGDGIADPVNYDGTELVLYRNFDPESWERVKETIEAGNTDADGNDIYDYRILKDNSLVMKREVAEVLTPEHTTDGNEGVTYEETLYEARSEDKMTGYLTDELAFLYNWPEDTDGDGQKIMKEIEFDCEGVDYAGYYVQTRSHESVYADDDETDEDIEYQNLYLRKGVKMIHVMYSGDIDLRSRTDLYLAKL